MFERELLRIIRPENKLCNMKKLYGKVNGEFIELMFTSSEIDNQIKS